MSASSLHPVVAEVTEAIRARSADSRAQYRELVEAAMREGPARRHVSCGNLAHAFAACPQEDKRRGLAADAPHLGIVTAYNDMLSAHAPFAAFPPLIKEAARACGASAEVAGGVPAMCDGVTQGRFGMEFSLLSREVIALGTAVALAHDVFDAALYLGVCDKIVPGLLIGALAFGHLPGVFLPAGPMPSGLPNREKAAVRRRYAAGEATRAELLAAESRSYHAPGTCTFYGTANSNQMLMEAMGLHLPGASFVPPETPLRHALTRAAVERAVALTRGARRHHALGLLLDERHVVNAIVTLLATGGSTNHMIHLPAIAAAAGIRITWEDFDRLSAVTPLLARIYPNGEKDINAFHAAGGTAFLFRELLSGGLLHPDIPTVWSEPFAAGYVRRPVLAERTLAYRPVGNRMRDPDVLRPLAEPFEETGGLVLLSGNLGRAVVKVSAIAPACRRIEAPARVFDDAEALLDALKARRITEDSVIVLRFQGPRANGMPELHGLIPPLQALQARGVRLALVTDGRLSGASGGVAAAIHVTPEAAEGGPLARLRDGDVVTLDCARHELRVAGEPAAFAQRPPAAPPHRTAPPILPRVLFAPLRDSLGPAEEGASIFRWPWSTGSS